MFRAIRALSAMLMLATFACTFDHSGLLPGSPPSGNDTTSAGGGGAGGLVGAGGALAGGTVAGGAAGGGTGGSLVNTGGVGPDAFADDDAIHAGGSGPGPDPDAQAFDARRDSDNPAVDVVVPSDADAGDADLDGSTGVDASRECSPVLNAMPFAPPGERQHCYWFHSFPSHWLGAANTCSAEAGHLVTISSSAENAFVLGLVATFPSNEWLWIGGTDGRFSSDGPGSGPYTWITGEPMSYVNWFTDNGTTEPDGMCKSCGGNPCYCEHRIAIRNDGRWVDGYEAIPYRYVCESD